MNPPDWARLRVLARRYLPQILTVLVALVGGVTLAVTTGDDDGDGRPDSVTITLGKAPAPSPAAAHAPVADDDGQATIGDPAEPVAKPVVVDANNQVEPGQEQKAGAEQPADVGPDIHEDARDETPPGAPADAAEQVIDAPVQTGTPRPPAGAQNYSCRVQLVRNYSDRAPGAKVSQFVLHYTVSRPGSLNAIWGLFNTPSFGASSTLLLEPTGRCLRIVPWDKKAWTQGAFNSVSESVEIMAMGTESRAWWLAQPIIRRGILASIVADRLRARGLPPKFVDPVGCTPRAGWTDHFHLECGNNHHDVKPNFPYDVLAAQIRRAYYGGNPLPISAADRVRCRKINSWRKAGRPRGGRFESNTRARSRALKAHGLTCSSKGPVRA